MPEFFFQCQEEISSQCLKSQKENSPEVPASSWTQGRGKEMPHSPRVNLHSQVSCQWLEREMGLSISRHLSSLFLTSSLNLPSFSLKSSFPKSKPKDEEHEVVLHQEAKYSRAQKHQLNKRGSG